MDEDVALLVQREMDSHNASFKDVVNSSLRRQLADTATELQFPTHDFGDLLVEVENFNHLASELEDDHLLDQLSSH